ncbi:glycosyltransferase family 2 protein [Daejeonella lutea]|uniref:Glycosyl transferase family 2 n=1 Tax=Daejeonella lutea TaxID=572036 RepID=A0A1T5EEH3_9SPHI|nr:glycosyltransferase [Daejeonella lutea]SKB82341.1 Glycosyl transferase family 2 [Daejeonella lutea]
MNAVHKFHDVTLLVTHYNRSESLERLLSGFRGLNCSFGEIVVSDDCSNHSHQALLKQLSTEYNFRLIGTSKNKGLAHNLNKGQDAVITKYTLYVQEDFIPLRNFPGSFHDALVMMEERSELDTIRFYSYLPYPYTIPYKKGFSEMLFKPLGLDYTKIYLYSDHPHLRRSDFLTKFGRYREKIPSDKAEYKMCLSFIQNQGKGLIYDKFKTLFEQYNPSSEPSTVTRKSWTLSSNAVVSALRYFYRQFKYNFDIRFSKQKN